jgi:hypothetical protein
MTYQELAQQALDVQDACNLSGVVHSFSRAMDVLWAEARRTDQGTQWVNEHPIVTLFLDKLASLNRIQGDDSKVYAAFEKVREIAAGRDNPEPVIQPPRRITSLISSTDGPTLSTDGSAK